MEIHRLNVFEYRFFEVFFARKHMESTGNHGGIQQLLAAEHEAQQIVNAARTGNHLQALFFFFSFSLKL